MFCIIIIIMQLISEAYLTLVNHRELCSLDGQGDDCPWFSFTYAFFDVNKMIQRIPRESSRQKYKDSIYLGLQIKVAVLLCVYPMKILFAYLQVRQLHELRARKSKNQEKPEISDHTLMVTLNASKEVGITRKQLEDYFKTTLNQDGYESPLEILGYYCSTERTSYDYTLQEIDTVISAKNYIQERQKSTEFNEKEKKKLEKLLKRLEKLHKKLGKKASSFVKRNNFNSLPEDDLPMNQRIIFSDSVAFVTLSDIDLRNNLIRAHRSRKMKAWLTCEKKSTGNHHWITMEPVPKLDQICWENVSYPQNERVCKRNSINVLSYFGMCLIQPLVLRLESMALCTRAHICCT